MASYVPPEDAIWREWFGRALGDGERIIGHCDTGPWNIIAREGRPVALIDWEEAGPVDRMVELAQTCWLNAQLYDDDIAARDGLGDAAARARDLRAIVDGYGLARAERDGLVECMIEFAVHAAANEARLDDGTAADVLGAVAWRTRSASWMLTHRALLEAALS
jgi:aminoglycoside phosphotransferase (APT) family kinase protein